MYGTFLSKPHCITDMTMHANTHASASKFYVAVTAGKKILAVSSEPQLYLCAALGSLGLF